MNPAPAPKMTPEEAIRDLVLALCPFARPRRTATNRPSRADYARARKTLGAVVDAIVAFDIPAAGPSRKRGTA